MNRVKKIYLPIAVLVLAAFAASCAGDQQKANKLVEEGNAAVTEAEKLAAEGDTKINQFIPRMADFPEGRDQMKTTSQEVLGLLDKGTAKLREAQKKFDEASKLNVEAAYKEYLTVKSQEYGKHAEHLEVLKDIPDAFMDPAVTDGDALRERIVTIKERVDKLQKEWNDLASRADKIYQENRDKFKN
ncbi:MAG TPA: hypothetical protein VD861_03980 [Pyrinomonadaceae bacterium]|jgi:hypothetical protein|nr:hypothetical protein [Pyrinomonadaceae bacterium]